MVHSEPTVIKICKRIDSTCQIISVAVKYLNCITVCVILPQGTGMLCEHVQKNFRQEANISVYICSVTVVNQVFRVQCSLCMGIMIRRLIECAEVKLHTFQTSEIDGGMSLLPSTFYPQGKSFQVPIEQKLTIHSLIVRTPNKYSLTCMQANCFPHIHLVDKLFNNFFHYLLTSNVFSMISLLMLKICIYLFQCELVIITLINAARHQPHTPHKALWLNCIQ